MTDQQVRIEQSYNKYYSTRKIELTRQDKIRAFKDAMFDVAVIVVLTFITCIIGDAIMW